MLFPGAEKSSFKTDQPAFFSHPVHVSGNLVPVPDIQFRVAIENKLNARRKIDDILFHIERPLAQKFSVNIKICLFKACIVKRENKITSRNSIIK